MFSTSGVLRWLLLAALSVTMLHVSPHARGEAPHPAPPKEYRVQLRYRIFAGRNQRLEQYEQLIKNLDSAGFKKDEGELTDPENPFATLMTGSIDSGRVRLLVRDLHVKSILLTPIGYKLPDEGFVKVQLELVAGLPLARQRLLWEQALVKLAAIGFRANTAFDHRRFTRILGSVPVGEVGTLLQDLRGEPSGWLAPAERLADLPLPLRDVSPILFTEIVPEPEGALPMREPPAPPAPPENGQEKLLKLSPDLRELAAKEDKGEPIRMEVILSYSPGAAEPDWQVPLIRAGAIIEGRLGPLVTIMGTVKQAVDLAAVSEISTIRLPRPAIPNAKLPKGTRNGNLEALHASGLLRLHTLRHRGKGVRVVVIDGDFRGYQALIGAKKGPKLPKGTRYLDLTVERNATLEPDPFPGDPKEIGHGTELALAVALAAPEAELTLVRVDPASPHQLQAVARYINGENVRSYSYNQRFIQLRNERQYFSNELEKLLIERKLALGNFGEDKEAVDQRDNYFKKQAAYDAAEKAFNDRVGRYLQLQRDFQGLKNADIVASALVWNEGYPLGGSSALSRYFDDRPFKAALWFQSAGNTRGQTWSGLFRDSDGNRVMEFTRPDTPLQPQRWTNELNFLGWSPFGKATTPGLPAQARVRLTMQWRETHDPKLFRTPEDPYRVPNAKLQMVLLRQRDPKGEQLFGDDLEVVARSFEMPQRLDSQPAYATYEQALEFTIDPAGRYALRVEGAAPSGLRPEGMPRLEGTETTGELRPRIFISVVDEASRKLGRPVFIDYPTELGTLGTPADANSLLTVGSVDVASSQPQSYSGQGPAWGLELQRKPDVLAFDQLRLLPDGAGECFGANQATGFAAGLTASSFSASADRPWFLRVLRERNAQGKPLRAQ